MTIREGILTEILFTDAAHPFEDAAFFATESSLGASPVRNGNIKEKTVGSKNRQAFERIAASLNVYFSGAPFQYDGAWQLFGLTSFQEQVLRFTQTIPHGATCTYGEVARKLGRPRAAQAVGAALSKNPLLILLPCHRVVPADGTVGGYCAGSWRKAALLQLEQMKNR